MDWAAIRRLHTIHEDEAVLALDKPAGISVMGERHDTDLVRLAADAGEELFPVHRIDKVTSGIVLFAKELRFHGDLTRQFQRRTVDKRYLALTRTRGLPATGTIDLPLSVGRKSRVRVAANRADITASLFGSADAPASGHPLASTEGADEGHWSVPPEAVFGHVRTYPSVTTFARLREGGEHTLLAATPRTGRRHQIRVHLAWIGHPIDGDPLFDKAPATRTFLHSWRLAFDAAWAGGARIEVEAPPDADFLAPVGDRLPADLLEDARR
ncbi:23S RNA-specific pseudouridylate synthase [Frankia torreyi]|uniref:RNA pseudouridylate synthase n=2 Tax=Frankia TaxID=1854 RepID=A0A0D8BKZ4_9ACTN|nr:MULTISPECIES: RluA family pseudouridine synthase [Frankia]AYF60765.1 putative RNA pseudouridine synthase [uncultured Frankia sp.]AYF60951.1 putative RNA pseudouridine synthase [uncultured Frankia sp.]KJE24062.1 23S RNA-specific pseudouridylate synthase [Frankia torreyi]KQC39413.1 pseudouridine synthase [Frankia sp. ACN1ag]KQM05979.1 23S RNA-specific pseudouridylate synthase [Frankia sp. CpI1-P]